MLGFCARVEVLISWVRVAALKQLVNGTLPGARLAATPYISLEWTDSLNVLKIGNNGFLHTCLLSNIYPLYSESVNLLYNYKNI